MTQTTTSNKISLEEIVETINTKYNIDLKKLLESYETGYKSIYIFLYLLAEEILKQFQYEKGVVNMRDLCSAFNIEIIEVNLKLSDDIFINDFCGYYDELYIHNRQIKTIYLRKEISFDCAGKHTLAMVLSNFIIASIIKDTEPSIYHSYHRGRFSKNPQTQLRTILASFLQMPLNTVLDMSVNYIENEKKYAINLDFYEYMQYLSSKLHLTAYDTVIILQNIMYLAEILYNYNGELGIELDDICKKIKNYSILFK